MASIVTVLRRLLWVVLIGAAGGVAWSWWKDRTALPAPSTPPEWPPLQPSTSVSQGASVSGAETAPAAADPVSTDGAVAATARAATAATTMDTVDTGNAPAAASVINALVDAPDARSSSATGNWVSPNEDGSCPPTHPIKANDNSGIFHVPGGRFYERTRAERCYASADAAIADGYRQAKA